MAEDAIAEQNGGETALAALNRGTNQSGMREHNERLVLSLLRSQGPQAKSDIARITGLSAQTVSVIMRELEQDGFLLRGEPQRGRVGQPSVPMSLAPEGAFFLGLKLGRRSADLVLLDFLGRIRRKLRRIYPWPTPRAIIDFVSGALPELTSDLTSAQRTRVVGLGVAMPYQLWSWVEYIGAPQTEMDAWRSLDLERELAAVTGLPVFVQNDASAACGAELIFGTGEKPRDFLYFYFGYFIGGGLVLNGRLFTGRTGNAAGVGTMPVPGIGGRPVRLMSEASLWPLARRIEARGLSSELLWDRPLAWDLPEDLLDDWMNAAASGLASAMLSAAALLELEHVMIDGWLPAEIRAEIVRRTDLALSGMDLAGLARPMIRAGTVGPDARALGAAAVPLAARFLTDPEAALLAR
ncbi:ROK family transcriptional regulator [Paracoccus aestuariivivens]|uniref:ROK family protein n=1 Tax=Paracoccus aestuariivivens TaxID=1820333 RepID=A0A6L6JF03_9RHOB|nr:ROK family transcriptional regulator [Paracoccus aestuariivivens]MTH80126.1 ROK family protein [Paracoccus aestuariivivens]